MRAIRMSDVRTALARAFNLGPRNYYDKLPAQLSTHPGFIRFEIEGVGRKIKLLSSAEAQTYRPRSRRPHRILIWDSTCRKWQFAGKYPQHCRSFKDAIMRMAHTLPDND